MRTSRGITLVALAATVFALVACGGANRPDVPPTESYGNPTATARPTNTPRPVPTARPNAGGGMAAPAPMGDNVVAFTTKDFAIEADKTSVKAGMVIFYLKNAGPSPHNIQIRGGGGNKATKTINTNESDQITVDVQSGMYDIICNVAGHEQLGMKIQLMVT